MSAGWEAAGKDLAATVHAEVEPGHIIRNVEPIGSRLVLIMFGAAQ